jgi:hypothetical protein
MHPQHIGRPGRLLMLERLISHIRSFPNVAFMRLADVADWWKPVAAPSDLVQIDAVHQEG